MLGRLITLLSLALLVGSWSMPAQAQPEGGEETTPAEADGDSPEENEPPPPPEEPPSPYKVHMNNGVRLFKAGLWDGAIAEFQAAYDAEPKASPLINLALTYKKTGDPVKAIEVLQQALRKHRDTMPPDQLAAAEREIKEMKALVAYVTVNVSPSLPTLKVFVDDEEVPGFATGGELALPPGMRSFRARAPGYADGEARVQIVSGRDNTPVELKLVPTMGEVIITAHHGDAWIEVDGAQKQRGWHREMLPPGVHVIRVLRGEEIHSIQIVVQAGERYAVTQDEDGDLESDATAPLETPEDDDGDEPFGPDVPKFLRGFYGLGEAAFLTAITNVQAIDISNDDRFGAGVGLHLGYRVSNWAAFEVFGQYSDIRVTGALAAGADSTGNPFGARDVTFVLKTVRLGASMRVMFPGKSWVRFVGNIGGGLVIEDLEWRGEPPNTAPFSDQSGLGPFGQLDLALEFEFQNVLVDILQQNIIQGTKQFDYELPDGREINAFETQPSFIVGPAVRVGYALW